MLMMENDNYIHREDKAVFLNFSSGINVAKNSEVLECLNVNICAT